MRNVHKIGEKIYIRSDEEIQMNEDAWYLWGDGIYKNKKGELPKSFCKKIILTTDQELIKDGVQSIDDDFLEWFFKNPTCEEVEIKKITNTANNIDSNIPTIPWVFYKIIIPKEEPKQETHICKYCKTETTQSDDECYMKPKQETLEEAAEKYTNNPFTKAGFIEGAKWQQERSYSEEEVKKAFEHGITFKEYSISTCKEAKDAEFICLLKQFKKKSNMKKLATKLTPAIKALADEKCSQKYIFISNAKYFLYYNGNFELSSVVPLYYIEVSEQEFLDEFEEYKPIIQILAMGVWTDCTHQDYFRIKPITDYSKEIEALQQKAKENGMKVTINFEKL